MMFCGSASALSSRLLTDSRGRAFSSCRENCAMGSSSYQRGAGPFSHLDKDRLGGMSWYSRQIRGRRRMRGSDSLIINHARISIKHFLTLEHTMGQVGAGFDPSSWFWQPSCISTRPSSPRSTCLISEIYPFSSICRLSAWLASAVSAALPSSSIRTKAGVVCCHCLPWRHRHLALPSSLTSSPPRTAVFSDVIAISHCRLLWRHPHLQSHLPASNFWPDSDVYGRVSRSPWNCSGLLSWPSWLDWNEFSKDLADFILWPKLGNSKFDASSAWFRLPASPEYHCWWKSSDRSNACPIHLVSSTESIE